MNNMKWEQKGKHLGKQIISAFVLVLIMLFPVLPASAVGTEPNKDGSGVYQIASYGQLLWFADKVNNDNQNFGSANAVLTTDMDVAGSTYHTAIGTSKNPFTGKFDGCGHVIKNLTVNTTANNQGVFGHIGTGGLVENVGLESGAIKGGWNVGGICGYNEGTIRDCYNTRSVSGISDSIGGICGNNDGIIQNCYNTGEVITTYRQVGGVCGNNAGTIQNCYNTGEVSGDSVVGGICGYNGGTIQNCYYNKDICTTGAIGGADDTANNVIGLTTEQMTGSGDTAIKKALGTDDWVYAANTTAANIFSATPANRTATVYYPQLKVFEAKANPGDTVLFSVSCNSVSSVTYGSDYDTELEINQSFDNGVTCLPVKTGTAVVKCGEITLANGSLYDATGNKAGKFVYDTSEKKILGSGNVVKAEISGVALAKNASSDILTLDVGKRAIGKASITAQKAYDGTGIFENCEVVFDASSGIVDGDELKATATAATNSANVDTYNTATITDIVLSGNDKDLYTLSASAIEANLTIELPVKFTALTANGTADETDTTALTITLDTATTLSANDITVTGAEKGTLTGSGTSYTLTISNITVAEGENVEVTLSRMGYAFTPASKNVVIHKAHVHSLTHHARVEATCTAVGNIEYWSCACGEYFSDEAGKLLITNHNSVIIPATEVHTWDGGVITTESTEQKEGVKTYTCTICHMTKIEPVPTTTSTVTPPTVSKPKSVKVVSKKKALKISWKKVKGVNGYVIQYSTKSNFKRAKSIKVSSSKKSATIKKLKSKKKYYIRICAYKTYKNVAGKKLKAYSKWVKIKKKTR